ncbi:MAG: type I-E CRISPR-associated protein Cse1/CasA [Lentisphaeria bacterium]|nr:type I-E CRISPR-associated protein Cse1/CasA [Lentisphaeria bacterium]
MAFNLCSDPWIPIAGSQERKSLIEFFTEPPSRLSGNAVDKIVILRFLLAIVHAANHIPDAESWRALTPETMAGNARAYLERHRDCFDLYGERPFLQFPQLAKLGGTAASPGSLMVYIAEGNKVMLSDWNRYRGLSEAEKAILLLRSACFACGGKKFDKDLCLSPGVVKGTGTSGTLLGFMGYLHAYMLGEDLWETLYLNLLSETDLREINAWPDGVGVPFWEAMPSGEADDRADEYRRSYQGQLFPLDKFLLLTDEGVIKTSGISYPNHKNGLVDPALTITSDGKNTRAEWAKTDTRPWRELTALLAFLQSNSRIQPYFLSMGMTKLRMLRVKSCTVWVGGVSVSSNSGEQYLSGMNDYVESEFAFPVECMTEESYQTFCKFMEEVENYAKRLYNCVVGYYKEMGGKENTKSQGERAKSLFWERMEPHAQEIVDLAFADSPDPAAIKRARADWFKRLLQIYEECCPRDTPRQLEAWVECHPGFQSPVRKGDK